MERYNKISGHWVDLNPMIMGELFPHEDGLAISPTSGQLVPVSVETPMQDMSARVVGRWQGGEFYPLGEEFV